MSEKQNEKQSDKPLVQFNDNGFVLNYSVTRNEEIAFIDYKTESITFKQMPLPISKISEILEYFNKSKMDHQKFIDQKSEEKSDESNDDKSSK